MTSAIHTPCQSDGFSSPMLQWATALQAEDEPFWSQTRTFHQAFSRDSSGLP
jgi:hypothetical protein